LALRLLPPEAAGLLLVDTAEEAGNDDDEDDAVATDDGDDSCGFLCGCCSCRRRRCRHFRWLVSKEKKDAQCHQGCKDKGKDGNKGCHCTVYCVMRKHAAKTTDQKKRKYNSNSTSAATTMKILQEGLSPPLRRHDDGAISVS
jgi:hypothetical protein